MTLVGGSCDGVMEGAMGGVDKGCMYVHDINEVNKCKSIDLYLLQSTYVDTRKVEDRFISSLCVMEQIRVVIRAVRPHHVEALGDTMSHTLLQGISNLPNRAPSPRLLEPGLNFLKYTLHVKDIFGRVFHLLTQPIDQRPQRNKRPIHGL
jgi:hypothetical protein